MDDMLKTAEDAWIASKDRYAPDLPPRYESPENPCPACQGGPPDAHAVHHLPDGTPYLQVNVDDLPPEVAAAINNIISLLRDEGRDVTAEMTVSVAEWHPHPVPVVGERAVWDDGRTQFFYEIDSRMRRNGTDYVILRGLMTGGRFIGYYDQTHDQWQLRGRTTGQLRFYHRSRHIR